MDTVFKTAILIDDDSVNNYLSSKIIKRLKICSDIKIAANGREGLDLVIDSCQENGNCPDLILLDLNMPIMDGHEFLEEYSKIKSNFPREVLIVVLTTSSHQEDIAKVKKYNVAGFINKPLSEEKVLAFVNENFPEN